MAALEEGLRVAQVQLEDIAGLVDGNVKVLVKQLVRAEVQTLVRGAASHAAGPPGLIKDGPVTMVAMVAKGEVSRELVFKDHHDGDDDGSDKFLCSGADGLEPEVESSPAPGAALGDVLKICKEMKHDEDAIDCFELIDHGAGALPCPLGEACGAAGVESEESKDVQAVGPVKVQAGAAEEPAGPFLASKWSRRAAAAAAAAVPVPAKAKQVALRSDQKPSERVVLFKRLRGIGPYADRAIKAGLNDAMRRKLVSVASNAAGFINKNECLSGELIVEPKAFPIMADFREVGESLQMLFDLRDPHDDT